MKNKQQEEAASGDYMAATDPVTLSGIEELCKEYADALDELEAVGEDIRKRIRKATRSRLRALKSRRAGAKAARSALRDAIEANPGLFRRPRTRALHGIEVGYRKKPGALEYADEAHVIERIRKKLGGLAPTLVVTKESLAKAAVKKLEAKTLASIGCSIVDVDDEVVLKAAKSDLDELIDALLADGEDEGDAA